MKNLLLFFRRLFMFPVFIPLCLVLAVFGVVRYRGEVSYKLVMVHSLIRFCWSRYIVHFLTCAFWAFLVAYYCL